MLSFHKSCQSFKDLFRDFCILSSLSYQIFRAVSILRVGHKNVNHEIKCWWFYSDGHSMYHCLWSLDPHRALVDHWMLYIFWKIRQIPFTYPPTYIPNYQSTSLGAILETCTKPTGNPPDLIISQLSEWAHLAWDSLTFWVLHSCTTSSFPKVLAVKTTMWLMWSQRWQPTSTRGLMETPVSMMPAAWIPEIRLMTRGVWYGPISLSVFSITRRSRNDDSCWRLRLPQLTLLMWLWHILMAMMTMKAYPCQWVSEWLIVSEMAITFKKKTDSLVFPDLGSKLGNYW